MPINRPHDLAISAADANRGFSTVLRNVREGGRYVVTSHGRPIARIVPYVADDEAQTSSRAQLLDRLRSQTATDIGSWRRDELYEG